MKYEAKHIALLVKMREGLKNRLKDNKVPKGMEDEIRTNLEGY